MNNNILELCRKHNIHLSMSLPGLTSFKNHTVKGNPSNVLLWFKKANGLGVPTTAGITVTKKNAAEFSNTLTAALISGADNILLNRFLPGGRGIEYAEELCLNKQEIVEILDTAEKLLKISGRYGSVGTELPKCIIKEKKYHHLKVGTRCSAAIDFFVVGPSGYIRVCNHSPVRLNHIDNLDELKYNDYWKSFVFKKYLPKECSGCNYLLNCDGGCREASHIAGGSINSQDPILK